MKNGERKHFFRENNPTSLFICRIQSLVTREKCRWKHDMRVYRRRELRDSSRQLNKGIKIMKDALQGLECFTYNQT
jgi:hypothetical protein